MVPKPWIDRARRLAAEWLGRGDDRRPSVRAGGLSPRRLEPRRVLSATIQSIMAPTDAVEGETVEVSAEATGDGDLQFDWTVTRSSEIVESGSTQDFTFVAPDEGFYRINLTVTDTADGGSDSTSSLLLVADGGPQIVELQAPASAVERETVDLSAIATGDEPLEYAWTVSLDDVVVETGTGQDYSFVPEVEGAYLIDLTVTDVDGQTDSSSALLLVEDGPPQIVELLVPATGTERESVDVSANAIGDEPLSYQWTVSFNDEVVDTGSTQDFSFEAEQDGVYRVDLVVTDVDGQTDTGSAFVLVEDAPPQIVELLAPATATEREPVDVTATAIGDEPLEYAWTVTFDDTVVATGSTQDFTFEPANDGVYQVDLVVTDVDGQTDSASALMRVEDAPPQIVELLVPAVSFEGETIDVSATVEGDEPIDYAWTVTVNGNVVAEGATKDFSFVPADNGVYLVSLVVTDVDEQTDTSSALMLVDNVAPTIEGLAATPINENQSTTLSGTITDPGVLDTLTLEINWGDPLSPGNTEVIDLTDPGDHVTYDAETGEFSVTHQYLDDNPTATSADQYTIDVTARDKDSGQSMAQTTVDVANVAPAATELTATGIDENGTTTLSGTIVDPGSLDTFTLSINWGDPLSPGNTEVIDLTDPGDHVAYDAETGEFSITHQYLDDNPTATSGDDYLITVTVADDDLGQSTATTTVHVANVAPQLADVAATDVVENGVSTLTGKILDVGTQDEFTLTVNWGDGEVEEFAFAAGTTEFSLTHQYLDDDPTGTASDAYEIRLTLVDDDLDMAVDAANIVVTNVAPAIEGLAATAIVENQSTTLTGTIVDPGSLDTFTLSINWGDPLSPGNTEVIDLTDPGDHVTYDAETGEFSVTHQYLDDNPTGTSGDTYTIEVTVADDDLGESTTSTTVDVANDTPTIDELAAVDVNEHGTTTLTGVVVDAGTLDTFTLMVDWGDLSSPETYSSASPVDGFTFDAETGEFSIAHQYLDDNPTGTAVDTYTITVVVTDDDLDQSQAETDVEVSNVDPEIDAIGDVTISEGEEIVIGTPAGDTSGAPTGATTTAPFSDVGTQDTHTAVVDWGDGTATEAMAVTQGAGGGSLSGFHAYADDGLYTVTITVTDDDGGVAYQSFLVSVENVDPTLTGTDGLVVDEGQGVTLAGLGVGISDPGYDNPLNSAELGNGGETTETFVGASIDWGDGATTAIDAITDRVSGGPGDPTTALFDHAEHHYADNGEYTVTVTLRDDDGANVERTFTITVNNVDPTLELTEEVFVLLEGDTLTLTGLGEFSDPGFDNPLNPLEATQETFDYTIDWGDGSVEELKLPVLTVSGGPGVATTGSLTSLAEPISHVYADNDVDNTYTITVTLRDDDGGMAVEQFDITVLNVNPTLDPVVATDLGGDGVTTLTLTFTDPGADTFEVLVDWGNKPGAPESERFVVEEVTAGPTPATFVITHSYTEPPDPDNPSADIAIFVMVLDDDFGTGAASVPAGPVTGEGQVPGTGIETGMSNVRTVSISNSGFNADGDSDPVAALNTGSDQPTFVDLGLGDDLVVAPAPQSGAAVQQQTAEAKATSGDVGATAERYYELRVLLPDGSVAAEIRLPANAMDDLPALISRLPDFHYQVWLIRSENNSERLVIDFYVRGGKIIDPSDDTEGARDRPPTSEGGAENGAVPPAEAPPAAQSETQPTPQDGAAVAAQAPLERLAPADLMVEPLLVNPTATSANGDALATAAGLAIAAAVSRRRGAAASWTQEVESALSEATEAQWRRLRWRKLPR